MTGISPLQSIHKRGLFGDHHSKNESDLVKISEIKNLQIFQVVLFKNSKVNINEIEIDGIKFPQQSPEVAHNNKTRILWNGPRVWLIISSEKNIAKSINDRCSSENFAVTDISHSRAVIQLKGYQTKEILKKGCPINFTKLKKNNCVGTVFQGINIIIDVIEDDPETLNLFALRSFAESFYHDITDSLLEEGYVGI